MAAGKGEQMAAGKGIDVAARMGEKWQLEGERNGSWKGS